MGKSKKVINLENALVGCFDSRKKMKIFIDLAKTYQHHHQLVESIKYAKLAIDLATLLSDDRKLLYLYYHIGESYILLGSYQLALENFFQSLRIAFQIKDNREIAKYLNSIGKVYSLLKDYNRSIEFYKEALIYDPTSSQSYNNIGVTYGRQGKAEKALEYLYLANEMFTKEGDDKGVTITLTNIAVTLSTRKKYEQALNTYKQAIKKYEETKNNDLFIAPYLGMAELNLKLKRYNDCIAYLGKAEKNSMNLHFTHYIIEIYRVYSEVFVAMGNFQDACQYLLKYTKLKEKFYADNINLAIQPILTFDRYAVDITHNNQVYNLKDVCSKIEKSSVHCFADVIGVGMIGIFSKTMFNLIDLALKYHQDSSVPVLIEGETGTGKEIIARLIHYGKNESVAPFISINSSAISPSLFESELFGYEGAAYTGSRPKGMPGKIELAHGGTLFLDEIGDLPMELQPKLLKFLEEKEIYRIGGIRKLKLDVRIVCATNKNIPLMIKEEKFRKDLYYRISTGHIYLPPLCDRKEEIGELAMMFLKHYSLIKNKKFDSISNQAISYLEDRTWEGNVRELKNLIERIVILFDDKELKVEHFNCDVNHHYSTAEEKNSILIKLEEDSMPLTQIEEQIIKRVLERFNGNISKAARYLNIQRLTLRKKLMNI